MGVGVGLICMISDYLINLAVAIQAARLIQRQNKFKSGCTFGANICMSDESYRNDSGLCFCVHVTFFER